MDIYTLIVYYILAFINYILILKTFTKILKIDFEFNKSNIIWIVIMSFFCTINNMFTPPSIRVITSTILFFIIIKVIFKTKFSTTLFNTICISIAMLISELIIAILLPLGIHNITELNNNIIFKVLLSFIATILSCYLIGNKISIKFFELIKTSKISIKHFYIFGILTILIFDVWRFISGNATANKTLNLILFVSEFLIILFIIISLKDKYKVSLAKIKEEQLLQNLKLYTTISNDYRELKHNLTNDLLTIKTIIPKKNQNIINDIINKYQKNYGWISDLTDIPEGIRGLIFLKKNQAEKQKIEFTLEYNINNSIENKFKLQNNVKLYEAIGVLLDNAIEATSSTKTKLVNIIFETINNKLYIKIFNTFNNSVDLDKITNKNYSTKNRGSGLGLNYLKNNKNKNFRIEYSIRENIFISTIIIDKK